MGMFASKVLNKEMDRFNKKLPQLVLHERQSALDGMPDKQKNNSSTIIERLLNQVYKVLNDYCPDIMNVVFHL